MNVFQLLVKERIEELIEELRSSSLYDSNAIGMLRFNKELFLRITE